MECCSRQLESNPCDGCPYDECGCGRFGKENFPLDVLTYVNQLEETINLMMIQMIGDCGCCKHGRIGDMTTCNKCLTQREYHSLWEYEGLPEVENHEKPV